MVSFTELGEKTIFPANYSIMNASPRITWASSLIINGFMI